MEEFIIEYFKNIAVNLKEIAHLPNSKGFYHIASFPDTQNLEFNLNNLKAGPILILENPEGKITDNNSDNPMHKVVGAFSILIKSSSDEEAKLNTLFDHVHKIALKIFSRIENDRNEGILDYAELEFNYTKVGPVASRYGRRYEFVIGQCIDIPFNENDWLDK